MKPCSSWHKPSAKEREGTPWKSCISRGKKRCCQSLLQMRLLRRVQSSLFRRRKKRTAVVTGQWGIHALSTSNHHDNAAATSFWCAELHGWTCQSQELHSGKTAARPWVPPLLQLVCRRGGCTSTNRHQHDCEMMRMAAPLFSLLRSNLSALRRSLSWLEMP